MAKRTAQKAAGWGAVKAAASNLRAQDQAARQSADAARDTGSELLEISAIKPRKEDTRPIEPAHVISLAESLIAVGLIEPIVVDRKNRLLAGGHRFHALKLALGSDAERKALFTRITKAAGREPAAVELTAIADLDRQAAQERFPNGRTLVVRRDIDAARNPEAALEIEVAENEKRLDYTREEVRAIADRLRAAGYHDKRGAVRTGDKALGPALATIVGKSRRTIQRILADTKTTSPMLSEDEQADKIIEKAVKRGIPLSAIAAAVNRASQLNSHATKHSDSSQ